MKTLWTICVVAVAIYFWHQRMDEEKSHVRDATREYFEKSVCGANTECHTILNTNMFSAAFEATYSSGVLPGRPAVDLKEMANRLNVFIEKPGDQIRLTPEQLQAAPYPAP
jgi:hypothetical protein